MDLSFNMPNILCVLINEEAGRKSERAYPSRCCPNIFEDPSTNAHDHLFLINFGHRRKVEAKPCGIRHNLSRLAEVSKEMTQEIAEDCSGYRDAEAGSKTSREA